jgi:hypothetical protein
MVPVVRSLLAAGARVTLAGTGAVSRLLSAEFPQLELLHLEGYGIRYPRKGRYFAAYLLSQLPRVYNAISAEKAWLERHLSARRWDWVISDNRYGLHHPSLKSILVTHQLYPRSGLAWLPDDLLHRVHRRLMRPFDEIWVPDLAGGEGLSGRLSHPPPGDLPVTYIGPLSRLLPGTTGLPEGLTPGEYFLALVSGPEPQRSIFEQAIREEAGSLHVPVVLVRGLPGLEQADGWSGQVLSMRHASPELLSAMISQAGWILCRSGYSTLMDLARMGRTAMLVPTPGQPEQEYLARHMETMGWFPQMRQESLSLAGIMDRLSSFTGRIPDSGFSDIDALMASRLCIDAGIRAGGKGTTAYPS